MRRGVVSENAIRVQSIDDIRSVERIGEILAQIRFVDRDREQRARPGRPNVDLVAAENMCLPESGASPTPFRGRVDCDDAASAGHHLRAPMERQIHRSRRDHQRRGREYFEGYVEPTGLQLLPANRGGNQRYQLRLVYEARVLDVHNSGKAAGLPRILTEYSAARGTARIRALPAVVN